MKIQFLGAARQVTGSRHYLEVGGLKLLIDCGMFQERDFVARNWEPCPVSAEDLDYLLLTHAHLDHSGLIPKLVHAGFRKPILTTAASLDLAEIILKDSARIQEEDVEFKRKRHERENRKGPHPLVPLYTIEDVHQALPLFRKVRYDEPFKLNENVRVTYRDAGHILGSAMLEIRARENGEERIILFSGDVGQWDKPIIRDPTIPSRADYVVMESTYGRRDHKKVKNVEDQLAEVINETVAAGGNLIIPTFAVERAQELMYFMARLVSAKRIPYLMTFLDSPMAVNVTEVFRLHRDCMDEEALELLASGEHLMRFAGMNLVRSVGQSKAINRIKGTCVIMAGSGMCTAGRIKHHLVNNASNPESTLLFVGYQAVGTLGRQLVNGKKMVRIHGKQHKVKARVRQIHGFSAHADHSGLMRWLGGLEQPPKRVFLVHGEEDSATQLADAIRRKWSCPVDVPDYREEHTLK